jgi:hypothetical protein
MWAGNKRKIKSIPIIGSTAKPGVVQKRDVLECGELSGVFEPWRITLGCT